MEEEGSIKTYFESCGGLDALHKFYDYKNFEIFSQASGLIEKYFLKEDFEPGDVYSQQYQNPTNIYDDTREVPYLGEEEEEDE